MVLMEENILIEKAVSGDVTAFEQLISNYQLKIFNIALQLSGNEPDARDISQEVLIKIYRELKSFRGESSFSGWLWRIVHNTFLNECKKSYKKKVPLTDSIDSVSYYLSDNSNPLDEVEKSYMKKQIKNALSKIPPEYSITVVMYDIQGFTYNEIAVITKCSIGTIKSRLNRGRNMLKEKLKIYNFGR
ncbi:MAG: hypothetical protein A2539_09255 [Elusimicrobia bacterium RIFOXYD2_FULL_34_15]|nr:MAG: hypothetical protein A2539_09255 [Elusimicrobia bacterium RIFOXYD2_FULL_34_15]